MKILDFLLRVNSVVGPFFYVAASVAYFIDGNYVLGGVWAAMTPVATYLFWGMRNGR